MILIYLTCRDKREAKKISQHLLKKRLIACSNVFPIESYFWWKGKIERSREVVLLAKSLEKKFEEIKKEIKAIHSYEVPLIEEIKVDQVNKAYLKWLKDEVKEK